MPFDTYAALDSPGSSELDPEIQQRTQLLIELGLGDADEEFDAFAAELAESFAARAGQSSDAEVPYAMVNIITNEQVFIGLHCPDGQPVVDRAMSREHGYCPEVLQRRRALVLPDVCAHPRFSSNAVVDQIGIRTYAGAPLIHQPSGIVLGTVCVVGTTPLPLSTGEPSRALIKDSSTRLMNLVA